MSDDTDTGTCEKNSNETKLREQKLDHIELPR